MLCIPASLRISALTEGERGHGGKWHCGGVGLRCASDVGWCAAGRHVAKERQLGRHVLAWHTMRCY